MLREVQSSSNMDKDAQVAARRLADRIRGWHSFEDALSNTRGDFVGASKLLKDVGTDEQSIGIWLESMVLNDNFITKLLENPVLPSQSHPPFLLRNTLPTISHDEFIVFVRAYIGVASVLAVWAWTDSLGHDVCRERTLALLQLWQGVDGYREVSLNIAGLSTFPHSEPCRLSTTCCCSVNSHGDWSGLPQITTRPESLVSSPNKFWLIWPKTPRLFSKMTLSRRSSI